MSDTDFSQYSSSVSAFTLRCCAAVVLADAITRTFPRAQIVACKATDLGFMCDFLLEDDLDSQALQMIEEQMQQVIVDEPPISSVEMVGENAAGFLHHHGQSIRAAIVAAEHSDEIISLLRVGEFMELCPLPHINSVRQLRAFSLEELMAHDRELPSQETIRVTRISGVVTPDRKALKQLLKKRKGAAARAHERLGRDAQLFGWHPAADTAGWLWYPQGTIIRRQLLDWWEAQRAKLGAQLVHTPEDMPSPSLHALIYQSLKKSPPALFGEVRSELIDWEGAEPCGLLRSARLTSDEFTWIGVQEQAQAALLTFIALLSKISSLYAAQPRLVFPVREGEVVKRKAWDTGLKLLKEAIVSSSWEGECQEDPGFTSERPAILYLQEDALGRQWPVCRIEVDPSLPCKLELAPQDGSLLWIQASAFVSLERCIALLLEQYAGFLPLWLAPEQVRLIAVGTGPQEYARTIYEEWTQLDLRVGLDLTDKKLADKVFNAEKSKVPYLIVIGDQEKRTGQVTLRTSSQEKKGQALSPAAVAQQLKREIEQSALPKKGTNRN